MNFLALSTTQMLTAIAVAVVVVAGLAVWFSTDKLRTERLSTPLGSPEYARAVKEVGDRRHAEAVLDGRTERVETLYIRPLASSDRARFIESWGRIQARFVDGPGSAVTDADQLVGDVMYTRGYPVSDFEQRAADISVDYPLVLESYRAAHNIALLQSKGRAAPKTCDR